MKFLVLIGSVRSNRLGNRVALFVLRQLQARGHDVVLFDAQELKLPLLDKMYKDYGPGEAPEPLPTMKKEISSSDAVVVVSGEYNHSIPPALANLLDYFQQEWAWRPSAIVCYSSGAYGGVRAAMQLRSMLAALGMSSIPSILPLPKVDELINSDGTPFEQPLAARASKVLDELEWYAEALAEGRARGLPH